MGETDLISRQAAIDAIDKYSVWVIYNDGMDDAELVESIIKQTKEAIKSLLIHDLPSAQPETEYTMEEFMYGQDLGSLEDGSL